MIELIRTNDVALISVVEGLLQQEDIPTFVADRHTSVIDGSLNWLQMRVMVPEDREAEARELLAEAELGHWLKAKK
ncbi:DUF2007 domain-containing protein [Nocardioides halotolerans]|jgi:hypothetical protein|uniref:putative signal transducing protein n=1 Tax=Nocardioides halotolerans TaxID=433660 RepID=UPI00042332C8|nr:DUF2007 domain-containing protein [Nocardioides halotolerans]